MSIELRPTAQAQAFRPEPMALDVRYEDPHLLVLNKPAGLVVHPAPGHWSGTLLNGLLQAYPGAVSLPRAGIVHRLDRDTSGVMVVAKTREAMQGLVAAIAARTVSRVYRAIVWGTVQPDEQDVQAPIGRDPRSRIRMGVVSSGKERPARRCACCSARPAATAPWSAGSTRDARTRSGFTWPTWGIPWSGTASMAALLPSAWCARPCTLTNWPLSTPARVSRCRWTYRCRLIWPRPGRLSVHSDRMP